MGGGKSEIMFNFAANLDVEYYEECRLSPRAPISMQRCLRG